MEVIYHREPVIYIRVWVGASYCNRPLNLPLDGSRVWGPDMRCYQFLRPLKKGVPHFRITYPKTPIAAVMLIPLNEYAEEVNVKEGICFWDWKVVEPGWPLVRKVLIVPQYSPRKASYRSKDGFIINPASAYYYERRFTPFQDHPSNSRSKERKVHLVISFK